VSGTQSLTDAEQKMLDQLEDEQARGESVTWDEPKTIRGIVARDVELVTYKDRNSGEERSKRVLTVRTVTGLVSVWEGPTSLTSRLFEGEVSNGPAVGPPAAGTLVIIRYLGERTAESGREYKAFEIVRGTPIETPAAPAPAADDDNDIPF
jgi:hypothetical protein